MHVCSESIQRVAAVLFVHSWPWPPLKLHKLPSCFTPIHIWDKSGSWLVSMWARAHTVNPVTHPLSQKCLPQRSTIVFLRRPRCGPWPPFCKIWRDFEEKWGLCPGGINTLTGLSFSLLIFPSPPSLHSPSSHAAPSVLVCYRVWPTWQRISSVVRTE